MESHTICCFATARAIVVGGDVSSDVFDVKSAVPVLSGFPDVAFNIVDFATILASCGDFFRAISSVGCSQ